MLDCLICRIEYNYTENIPKILPDCGHTVCSACLAQILQTGKCPECRKAFSKHTPKDVKQFQTNIALQRVIETMTDFCKEHQSPLTQACLTEKVKICINCAKYGNHQDHVIDSLENTRAKASKKIQDYQKREADIEKIVSQNNEFLVKLQDETLKTIENDGSFQEYLEMTKGKYLWDLEFLLMKKACLDQSKITEIATFNEKISNIKKTLKEEQMNKEFFEALDENIEHPIVDENQKNEIQIFAEQLECSFTSAVHKLENYGTSVIQKSFGEIKFTNFFPVDTKALELTARLEVLSNKCFDISTEDETTLVISPKTKSNFELNIFKEGCFEDFQTLVLKHSHAKFNDEMLDGLHYLCRSYTSAISIRLDFDPNTFIDKDLLSCLNYPFWKKGSVVALSMNLTGCKLDREATLKEFLESSIRQARDLTGLCLKLDSTSIAGLFLRHSIWNVIPLVESLQELSLSLSKTEVTDEGIKALFGPCLEKMLKLKVIYLDISSTSISPQGLDILFQGMKKVDGCKNFSLNCSNLSVRHGDIGLYASNYLKAADGKLENLSLNFSNTQLNTSNIQEIYESLPQNLEQLNLIFPGTEVTDQNVQKLASVLLSSKASLKILKLDFRDTAIRDDSLFALSEMFLKNQTLEVLNLNFSLTRISEELLCSLITDVITQIVSLSKFNITVNNKNLGSGTIDLINQINQKYK